MQEAAANGADLIVLPEMFVAPYTRKHMLANKEALLQDYKTNDKCETSKLLSHLAKSLNKYPKCFNNYLGISLEEVLQKLLKVKIEYTTPVFALTGKETS